MFNACLQKSNKTCLISYLNALIHGLLRATNSIKKSQRNRPADIEIITFDVGDLLRCRCFSREA